MSQAEELLNSLSVETTSTNDATEGHIVIGNDRFITVPEELKRIGVQYDHNIETVTFDCPRYWDGLDMSQMVVYINYMLPNGTKGCYVADNVTADDTDNTIMHFDWTISRNVTQVKGTIFFLVCVKKTDEEGNEVNHWNSELCKTMYVSEGLECEEVVVEEYPDIITSLLERMSKVENITVDVNTNVIDMFKTGKTDYQFTSKRYGTFAADVNTDADVSVVMYDYRFICTSYPTGNGGYYRFLDMVQNSNNICDMIYANNMFIGVGDNGCIRYSNYNELVSTDESGSVSSINEGVWTDIFVGDKNFRSICHGNGMFVAIGEVGTLAYSTDGVTWTNKTIFGGNASFETICYGDGKFVALGKGTINASSEDGINWTSNINLDISADNTIYDVIYANDKYVAVGTKGITLYSNDAVTWNTGVSDNVRSLYSVTYGNGKFVAVGPGISVYSEDGINWTTVNTYNNAYFVKYIDNKFGVLPDGYPSEDGITWPSSSGAFILSNSCFETHQTENLAYCNGRFLSTSHSITFGAYSDDGINWTAYFPRCGSERVAISSLISYNDMFMGFGVWNDSPTYISSDGINWIAKAPCKVGTIAQSQFNPMHAYGNGKLIVANVENISTTNTTKMACTENNGDSWESINLEGVILYDLTYGNGKFVGVGKDNIIAYSSDGLNWTTATIDFKLLAITYGNGRFIGVGTNTDNTSFSAYSIDGISWVKNGIIDDAFWTPKDIIYNKGQYVYICGDKSVFCSSDGSTWTKVTSETFITKVVYGNGKFISNDWNYFAYSIYKTEPKPLSDVINNILTIIDEQSAAIDKSLGDIQTAFAEIVEVSE